MGLRGRHCQKFVSYTTRQNPSSWEGSFGLLLVQVPTHFSIRLHSMILAFIWSGHHLNINVLDDFCAKQLSVSFFYAFLHKATVSCHTSMAGFAEASCELGHFAQLSHR